MYPESIAWPRNVTRFQHLPPAEHRRFYNSQRATLNATRADMVRLGWSPSVRLFEAAACGTPIISDRWQGLEELFVVGEEILVADTTREVLSYLRDLDDDALRALGARARQRILAQHTAAHRAAELEGYVYPLLERAARRRAAVVPLQRASRPGTA
jgi:spore maturation protein CgeB